MNYFDAVVLLPKDYPGLRDTSVPLSFSRIMGTAWQNVRFTRDGAPQAILFFAVIGIIIFGTLATISAFLSFFIGHAHAQTSEFTLPGGSTDVAQAWINYLFLGVALPDYYTNMDATTPTTFGVPVQAALLQVLAFYSDAILIIAAMILFYHLTAMVMETAHHGEVMGKHANKIWAPIRLVVAIGLLIPINTGLNSGQYIVIKVAEVGSALGTNAWTLFLTALTNYNPTATAPQAPFVTQSAANMLAIQACVYDYNQRVNVGAGGQAQNLLISEQGVVKTGSVIGGHTGTKYSFSPTAGSVADTDICGWYFVPASTGVTDTAAQAAYVADAAALRAAIPALAAAAGASTNGIQTIMDPSVGGTAQIQPITFDTTTQDAVVAYQVAVSNGLAGVAANNANTTAQAVEQLEPYGWVFAGALLNMVSRIQAMLSNAVTAGMPVVHPPTILDPNSEKPGFVTRHVASNNASDIRTNLALDLANYNVLLSSSWAQKQATNSQCAAMVGLGDSSDGTTSLEGFSSGAAEIMLEIVDHIASMNNVWTGGAQGQACGTTGAGAAGLFNALYH